MNSFRVFVDRKMVYMVAILALLLSTVSPMFAAAAQVTTRSIELSSSVKSATGVSYNVNFTSVGAAGAFVVDFCSNSPLAWEDCTAPTGLDVTTPTSTTSGFTTMAALDTNTIRVQGTIGAASPISVEVNGLTNPSSTGPLYARITTYDTYAHAAAYVDTTADSDYVDTGSAAASITDKIGVSGSVLESMLFCVAKVTITADCANAAANPPVLALGQDVGGGVIALGTTTSTGDLYTQISTNAATGAIVSLKSSTPCGGLMRVGASGCDIAPSLNGITAGDAEFGVKVAAAADTGTSPTGAYGIKTGSGYTSSDYYMHWVSGNLSGIGSTYGDPFLDTAGAPANNKNVKLTFGAQINNATPAGSYATELSMIATGKF